jgi:hypothetical protein
LGSYFQLIRILKEKNLFQIEFDEQLKHKLIKKKEDNHENDDQTKSSKVNIN